ncbi:LacI family DNA-binding transcriptional regulator [Spirillospora sp. NPDC048911]|uniref:LacI family DNA-binding transcriptional regulator n=1 Tax=Spirillospora sp. NPDC048911 TaxID=3364527 RepID=UPI00371E5747
MAPPAERRASGTDATQTTSADVARAAGVSRGAVSQILNGRGQRFSAETRARVLDTARRLDYQPSSAARTLARGMSDVVVVVAPNTTFGTNLQDICDELTHVLSEHGLTVVLRFATGSMASFDRLVAGLRPAAVLPLIGLDAEHRDVLTRRGVPLATSPRTQKPAQNTNHAIGALQARHLVERGHDRLAYAQLVDHRDDVYGDQRLDGLRLECRRLGVPHPQVLGVAIDATAADHVLRSLRPGVAVACYNDEVALTLLAAALRQKWDVPRDLALIGVDDIPLAGALTPRLTTIAYDAVAIARRLAAAVLASLDLPDGEPVPPDDHLRLVPGETT